MEHIKTLAQAKQKIEALEQNASNAEELQEQLTQAQAQITELEQYKSQVDQAKADIEAANAERDQAKQEAQEAKDELVKQTASQGTEPVSDNEDSNELSILEQYEALPDSEKAAFASKHSDEIFKQVRRK